MRLLRSRAEYVVAGAAYLAASVSFYWSVLFGNATLPVDLPDYDYPRFFFLAKWIHRGVLPMWDPHVGFGIPLAGMMGRHTFYPPVYLAALLGGAAPSIRVVEWITISHLAWAGLGTYTLCRALKLSRPACFTGGLLLAFGGFFALRLFHETWVETASWFPFALAAWVRFLETRNLKYTAIMSGVFLGMLFAGSWQQVMNSMYFAGFWGVWESLRRRAFLPVLAALVVCGAALLCDTCELLPTYEYARESARQKLTYEDSASTGVRVSDVPAILWAGMFIGKDGEALWNARRVNSGIRDYYPGTIALILLAYNAILVLKRPEKNQLFLWVAMILFAAASFGPLTPIFGLLYKFAPGFSFFRRSGALYYFPVLAGCVLSAYSLDDILSRTPTLSARWASRGLLLLGIIPAVTFLAFEGHIESRGALIYFAAIEVLAMALFAIARFPAKAPQIVYLLAFVCMLDLYYFHGVQFAFLLHNYENPQVGGIPQIANSDADPYRVAIAPFNGPWDNYGEIAGFENPGGYIELRLERYQEYFKHIQNPDSPLLALANARYLLTSPLLMHTGLRTWKIGPTENRVELPSGAPSQPPYVSVGDFPGNLKLFRNVNATPRYYFSSSIEVIKDAKTRFERMSSPAFSTRRAAVLEETPGTPIDDCAADPVSVLNYTPNEIKLNVVSRANCLLVASDSYHAEWRTYIDGKPTRVYVADVVFRALVVPAGAHSIECKFEPRTLWLGMAISAAGCLGLAGLYSVLRPIIERT